MSTTFASMPIATLLTVRRTLGIDAVLTGVTGLLLATAAGPLSDLLALPVPLLRWAGIALLGFVAFLGWAATRARIARRLVVAVIAINALWAIDSALLLFTGWVAPNGLGIAFVLVQAAAVAGLAELQYVALRRPGVEA